MALTKISLHHIGGKSGSSGFPVLKPFEKDMVQVFYDADKDCIQDIIEKNKKHAFESHVFPYCVGGMNTKASFALNYSPFTSSLLSLNPDYNDYYTFNGECDHILKEDFRVVKSIDIDIVTLDSILEKNGIQKPDFLSIDTEGSEYEILQGAQELLDKNILGVVVETAFKQLRKDQKLFGDINGLLTASGFEFIRFAGQHSETSPYRAPIGLRGKGHHLMADALFLKREGAIDNKTFDDFVKLNKLAFFSIAFQQLETGLQYLSKARGMTIAPAMREDISRRSYFSFLCELEQKAGQIKDRYPPKSTEIYASHEEYLLAYDDIAVRKHRQASIKTPRDKIVGMIKKSESLYKMLKALRGALKGSILRGTTIVNDLMLRIPATNSPIEQFLYDYGFNELAKVVKSKRLTQEKLCK